MEAGSRTIAEIAAALDSSPLVTERGGYTLTMRECAGSEEALARLSQEPGIGLARLHCGWGSFRNLDIVAARECWGALLLDVNVHQFRVWDAVRQAASIAHDAPAFVDAVVPLLPHEPRLRQFAGSTHAWLQGDLEREGSWLCAARPERYRHVRALFRSGRIVVACADLRQSGDVFAALSARVARAGSAGIVADTLYVSNIPWMLAQPTGFFGESHQPFLAATATSVVGQVRGNIEAVAKHFRWVVSAMQLRADATADNLQWLTQLQSPQEFLAPADWDALSAELPATDPTHPG